MTEQPAVPTTITSSICASTETYSPNKPYQAPHQYNLKCEPCDVKWRSPTAKDNCWSCGEERVQWQ